MSDDDNEQLMRALVKMQAEGKIHIIGEQVFKADAPQEKVDEVLGGMGLAFAFADQSEAYTNGFEAGMIWARIEAGEVEIDKGVLEGFPVHAENLETIKRMAAHASYAIEVKPTPYEGWTSIRLTKSVKSRPGLRVVEGTNNG